MSNEASPAPAAQPDPASMPSTVYHPHKSYRRKYRKIMVKFERQMRESSTLFRDQQRILDISQRIAEQNDQILSMLLELNSHPQIPARLRFDLRDPAPQKARSSDNVNKEIATEQLRLKRYKVQKGDIRQPEYDDYEQYVLGTTEFAPQISYSDLVYKPLRGPLERASEEPDDSANTLAGGLLSSKQEEQYLQSLDSFLDGRSVHPRAHATSNIGYPHPEKSADRERESQIRNPVSVYNWLRKNQPQVFLQDPDHDKTKIAAALRKSKRESIAKAPKVEPELYDDDGIALEPSGSKGKRKRDEDTGYRPKGGHARPTKRRKEDSGRRSKRASMDISAS